MRVCNKAVGKLIELAGSPFFERKSSKKTNFNSFGAIFYILGRLFLCIHFYPLPYPSPSKPSMRPRLSNEGSNTK